MNYKFDFKKYFIKNHLVIIFIMIIGFLFFGNNFSSQNDFNSANSIRSFESYSSKNIQQDFIESKNSNYEKIYSSFTINSKNVENDYNKIVNFLENENYLILNKNLNLNKNYKNSYLNIKIIKNEYQNFLKEFSKKFNVDEKSISISNVEKQFNNYGERIKRYEEQLLKYKKLLKKEISISDEIEINNRIDEIEDKIYYIKKNFGNLNEDIEYVNININIKEEKFFNEFNFTFKNLINDFLNGFFGFIEWISGILGLILIPAILFFIIRFFKKK